MAHDQRAPQADSCQLDTNPESTSEEPRRCPNETGSGVHGKGLVPNVRLSNNVRTVSEQAHPVCNDGVESGWRLARTLPIAGKSASGRAIC